MKCAERLKIGLFRMEVYKRVITSRIHERWNCLSIYRLKIADVLTKQLMRLKDTLLVLTTNSMLETHINIFELVEW